MIFTFSLSMHSFSLGTLACSHSQKTWLCALIGLSKIVLWCECVNDCLSRLSLCCPGVDWWLFQGVPCLSPKDPNYCTFLLIFAQDSHRLFCAVCNSDKEYACLIARYQGSPDTFRKYLHNYLGHNLQLNVSKLSTKGFLCYCRSRVTLLRLWKQIPGSPIWNAFSLICTHV